MLIEVSRAGLNFADTHQRHEPVRRQGRAAAGARAPRSRACARTPASASSRWPGAGGYAEYADGARALTFPIPDGVERRARRSRCCSRGSPPTTCTARARALAAARPWSSTRRPAASARSPSSSAKPLGAGRVIATASSEEKRALALELGADAAIDSGPDGHGGAPDRGEPRRARRRGLRDGRRARRSTSPGRAGAVRPHRRVRHRDAASRTRSRTGNLLRSSRAVVGFWLHHCLGRPAMIDEALAELFERVERGALRAIVGGTYPLSEAARAQADLAERRTTGKLVLDPCARPSHGMTTFADLGLSEPLLEALRDVGYESPSPIQVQAIPPLLEGRDVIGQAQTGTGKTAAFGLPLLEYVDPDDADDPGARADADARAVHPGDPGASAPTAPRKGVDVVAVFGGAPIRTQQAQLRGRRRSWSARSAACSTSSRATRSSSTTARFVVLDEADEMLDLGLPRGRREDLRADPGIAADGAVQRHDADARSAGSPTLPARSGDREGQGGDAHHRHRRAVLRSRSEPRDKPDALARVLDAEKPRAGDRVRADEDPRRPALRDAARPRAWTSRRCTAT